MLGTARRRTPGSARNRNFVRRQLNGIGTDIATPQRVETLRQAFAGDLPTVVENELSDLRRLNLSGRELVLRLELLQERYRLNPERQGVASATAKATRIICSDGLLCNDTLDSPLSGYHRVPDNHLKSSQQPVTSSAMVGTKTVKPLNGFSNGTRFWSSGIAS